MKKIIYILITLSFLILPFCTTKGNALENEDAILTPNEYCAKGDKILAHYEKLEDKTNSSKYLNAAKYYYYQAARLDISNINSMVGVARVSLYKGNTRDAKNALMVALNVNENNPKVNYYLGEAFFVEGEYFQAIDFYTHAYSNGFSQDYNTNLKLGICYEKLDDTNKSKFHYNNALKINPNSQEVKERLKYMDTSENAYRMEENEANEDIDAKDIEKLNMPNL